MTDTSVPVGGTTTSGVFRDRSNENHPDALQEMQAQARADHDFATGKVNSRPAFTRKGPDREELSKTQPSHRSREEAEEAGEL